MMRNSFFDMNEQALINLIVQGVNMDNTFNVGKIVNTHGIKGEIRVYVYTDDPYKFEDYKYFLIEGKGEERFKITRARVHKGMAIVKLQGYNTPEEVMPLMDKNVYIYRDDAEDDGEGHYIVDLIGCQIVDETGKHLGQLVDVLQNTAQDLYEIKSDKGQTFLLPVVDEFVLSIDLESQTIVVKIPEGLLEA